MQEPVHGGLKYCSFASPDIAFVEYSSALLLLPFSLAEARFSGLRGHQTQALRHVGAVR